MIIYSEYTHFDFSEIEGFEKGTFKGFDENGVESETFIFFYNSDQTEFKYVENLDIYDMNLEEMMKKKNIILANFYDKDGNIIKSCGFKYGIHAYLGGIADVNPEIMFCEYGKRLLFLYNNIIYTSYDLYKYFNDEGFFLFDEELAKRIEICFDIDNNVYKIELANDGIILRNVECELKDDLYGINSIIYNGVLKQNSDNTIFEMNIEGKDYCETEFSSILDNYSKNYLIIKFAGGHFAQYFNTNTVGWHNNIEFYNANGTKINKIVDAVKITQNGNLIGSKLGYGYFSENDMRNALAEASDESIIILDKITGKMIATCEPVAIDTLENETSYEYVYKYYVRLVGWDSNGEHVNLELDVWVNKDGDKFYCERGNTDLGLLQTIDDFDLCGGYTEYENGNGYVEIAFATKTMKENWCETQIINSDKEIIGFKEKFTGYNLFAKFLNGEYVYTFSKKKLNENEDDDHLEIIEEKNIARELEVRFSDEFVDNKYSIRLSNNTTIFEGERISIQKYEEIKDNDLTIIKFVDIPVPNYEIYVLDKNTGNIEKCWAYNNGDITDVINLEYIIVNGKTIYELDQYQFISIVDEDISKGIECEMNYKGNIVKGYYDYLGCNTAYIDNTGQYVKISNLDVEIIKIISVGKYIKNINNIFKYILVMDKNERLKIFTGIPNIVDSGDKIRINDNLTLEIQKFKGLIVYDKNEKKYLDKPEYESSFYVLSNIEDRAHNLLEPLNFYCYSYVDSNYGNPRIIYYPYEEYYYRINENEKFNFKYKNNYTKCFVMYFADVVHKNYRRVYKLINGAMYLIQNSGYEFYYSETLQKFENNNCIKLIRFNSEDSTLLKR